MSRRNTFVREDEWENYKEAPDPSRKLLPRQRSYLVKNKYPFFFKLNIFDDFPYCFLQLSYDRNSGSLFGIGSIKGYKHSSYKNNKDFLIIKKLEESTDDYFGYHWSLILEEVISDLGIKYTYNIFPKSIEFSESIPSSLPHFKHEFTLEPFQGYVINFFENYTKNYQLGPRTETRKGSSKFDDYRDKKQGGIMNIYCDKVIIDIIPVSSSYNKFRDELTKKESPFKY